MEIANDAHANYTFIHSGYCIRHNIIEEPSEICPIEWTLERIYSKLNLCAAVNCHIMYALLVAFAFTE